jgi:ATP-dependent 26S proteasome regulatory subunit
VTELPKALDPALATTAITRLGGLDQLIHSLCMLITHRCVDADHIRTSVCVSPPGGVLLSGPPGTGR